MIKKFSLLWIFIFSYLMQAPIVGATETHSDKLAKYVMGGTIKGIRNNSKSDAEITFNNAVSTLLKPHNIDLKIIIYASTEAMKLAFDQNKIQGMFGSPLEFMEFKDQLKPQMAMKYKGVDLKQSMLVLARDKDADLSNFRGKRLTLSNFQDLEALYLNTLLLEKNLPEANQLFASIKDVKNANIAMMDVFFGRSDMTVVRENEYKVAIELNPQLAKKLHILKKSPGYITLIGASRKDDSRNLTNVIKGLTSLKSSEKGVRLLSLVKADSLVAVNMDDMKEVFDLVKKHQALKAAPNQ